VPINTLILRELIFRLYTKFVQYLTQRTFPPVSACRGFPGGVAEGSVFLRYDSESMPNRKATFRSYLQDISTLEGEGVAPPLPVLM
jgi:hypothetical protein